MQNKNVTKVIKVNNETKEKMINFYKDMYRDKVPPYAIFQADTGDTIVTLYASNKVMFQGISADMEASLWTSNQGIVDDLVTSNKQKKEHNEELTIPRDINSIGSDEVGTGDYFGPIVVTASYVTKEDIPFLTELGVKDSKKMSDETILSVVPKFIKKIPHETLILNNEDYNKYHTDNFNMNKMKAILHNKALYTLKQKGYTYDYIVVDQFEPPKSYYNHIKETPKKVEDVTFITKAEDKCLSVACSSLISRFIFLKEMDKLSDQYGIFFPKGASNYVEDIGIKLINKYGDDILTKVAKLNFQNTNRIYKYKDRG